MALRDIVGGLLGDEDSTDDPEDGSTETDVPDARQETMNDHEDSGAQNSDSATEQRRIQSLESRIDDVEGTLETYDTSLTRIQSSQDEMSESVEELTDTVRQLLGVYDQVTRSANPFVADSNDTDSGFGLFDTEESQATVDARDARSAQPLTGAPGDPGEGPRKEDRPQSDRSSPEDAGVGAGHIQPHEAESNDRDESTRHAEDGAPGGEDTDEHRTDTARSPRAEESDGSSSEDVVRFDDLRPASEDSAVTFQDLQSEYESGAPPNKTSTQSQADPGSDDDHDRQDTGPNHGDGRDADHRDSSDGPPGRESDEDAPADSGSDPVTVQDLVSRLPEEGDDQSGHQQHSEDGTAGEDSEEPTRGSTGQSGDEIEADDGDGISAPGIGPQDNFDDPFVITPPKAQETDPRPERGRSEADGGSVEPGSAGTEEPSPASGATDDTTDDTVSFEDALRRTDIEIDPDVTPPTESDTGGSPPVEDVNGDDDGDDTGGGRPSPAPESEQFPLDSGNKRTERIDRDAWEHHSYAVDLLVLEWLSMLVRAGGTAGCLRALRYYQQVGWIDSTQRSYFEDVLTGPNLDIDVDPHEPSELTTREHAKSYAYAKKIRLVQRQLERGDN